MQIFFDIIYFKLNVGAVLVERGKGTAPETMKIEEQKTLITNIFNRYH